MQKEIFIGNKKVSFFFDSSKPVPFIYFNGVFDSSEKLWNMCKQIGCGEFALVAISGLNWDDDMTPWYCPALSKKDTPCGGKADEYLTLLTDKIMPAVAELSEVKPLYNAITGYSLAGLFALYSLYKTDKFSKAACASGSFWYPDFNAYAMQNKFIKTPDCIYFSLGDKESKTANARLRTVQTNTETLEAFYKNKGIKTTFVLNKGNHFQNTDLRMANGIKWILEE